MQISEMKAIKLFCVHKHKSLVNPNKSPKFLYQVSRQFRSTNKLLFAEESESSSETVSGNGRQVWSFYDPVLGRLVSQRSSAKRSDERDLEPEVPDFYKQIDDLERQRTYGSAKNASLSVGDREEVSSSSLDREENFGDIQETHLRFSSIDKEICDIAQEKGFSGLKGGSLSDGDKAPEGLLRGNEDFLEENSYGNQKKENLGNGERNRMGLSSYSNWNLKEVDSVNVVRSADIVGNKKKGKSKISYVCDSCGYRYGQWWGICRACGKPGTLKQFSEQCVENGGRVTGFEVSEKVVQSWLPQQAWGVQPLRLTDVKGGMNQINWRIPLSGSFGAEVARVLGGGLIPGSLVLVGGDPGVGKSTLLLQIAAILAEGQDLGKPAPVVYVSGEESVEQIGNRADRMSIETEELFLYSSTDIEDILEKIQPLFPRALIIDSIQTVHLKGVAGSAGGIYQVKECTSALLRFAKTTNIPVLLIGHVTKSGDIAGPRVLEHIVDVVLYMEGEKHSSHRLLRPVKNRFGSTDELGVFEMSKMGLEAVSNPSQIFLSDSQSDSEVLVGLAIAVIMDGSRSFLIEVQALCVSGPTVSRHMNGIQSSRADMIISVLKKQAGLMLQDNAIFLNVVSGVMLTETAGDLAIAAAICSSFLELPIPNNIAFIGEIGLGGEIRTVPRMEKRVNTLSKLGYKMCIVPRSAAKSLESLNFEGMKIVGCKDLKEVIKTVFKRTR